MSLSPEQAEHINVVNWFNYNYPEFAEDFHHFANERACSVTQGRTLKRMGVKRGVFDFFLAIPRNGKAGLWVELKVGKNKPSKEQLEFEKRKTEMGYVAMFAVGFDAAKDIISAYLCA